MLEKDRHPRFHIGESWLPMNMPILQRLGVLEQVRAIGVFKLGADFPNNAGGYDTFHFAHALDAQSDDAFQVPRANSDQVLAERIRAIGATLHEVTRVETVQPDGARPMVQARSAEGLHRYRPRYLIDTSGRDTFLGNRLKLKRANARHSSAALLRHFRGVTRRPSEDAGDISIAHECTRMSRLLWLMLDDAYTFVDPKFFSGIYLAMHGAGRGAAMIDATLRDPTSEAGLQRRQRHLEKHLLGGLDRFTWFIYRFTSPIMRELFAQPRNVPQMEQAIVAMAGNVFDRRAVLHRLRVFFTICAICAVTMLARAWRAWCHRCRHAREQFHGDTLHREPS